MPTGLHSHGSSYHTRLEYAGLREQALRYRAVQSREQRPHLSIATRCSHPRPSRALRTVILSCLQARLLLVARRVVSATNACVFGTSAQASQVTGLPASASTSSRGGVYSTVWQKRTVATNSFRFTARLAVLCGSRVLPTPHQTTLRHRQFMHAARTALCSA